MIARYYPIALTLPDGPDRTVVATVVGVDHALAQDLLAEVRALVVASGRSQVEAAAIRLDLDGGEQIAAAAPLYPLASLAAAQIVAWLADDVTAAA